METKKIKSVQEYIELVENLQEQYSQVFFNEDPYTFNKNKEFGLAILEEIQKDIRFKEELEEFMTIFQNIRNKCEATFVKIGDVEKLLLTQLFVAYMLEDFQNINRIVESLNSINLNFSNNYNNVISETKENEDYLKQFIEKNKSFVTKFPNELLNNQYSGEIEYFFRGQSNVKYGLSPSVYRGNLKENEATVINTTLADRFDEFQQCSTMYEKLIKMQHYGIPTRVLDLTGNSLAALYFACEPTLDKSILDNLCSTDKKKFETDGAIFLFSAKKENVCYPDSDKVRILSNLSKLHKFEYCPLGNFQDIYECINKLFYKYLFFIFEDIVTQKEFNLNDEFVEEINIIIENTALDLSYVSSHLKYMYRFFRRYQDKSYTNTKYGKNLKETYNLFLDKKDKNYNATNKICTCNIEKANTLFNELQIYINHRSCDLCNKKFNCVNKLVNQVREEKPSFESRIITSDLSKWLIVKGAKNNSRVKQQDVHFIIVPNSIDHKRVMPFEVHKKKFNQNGFEEFLEFT